MDFLNRRTKMSTSSENKYTSVWQGYKNQICRSLIKSDKQQMVQLNKENFTQVGNRKSYTFNLEYKNGTVNNNIGGSAVARDLDKIISKNEEIKNILRRGNYKINLDNKFILHIRKLNPEHPYHKDEKIKSGELPLIKKNKKTNSKPEIVDSEKEMNNPIYGLEAIVNDKTKILILGTFPTTKSIKEGFYYQNQIKRFWGQALSSVTNLENMSNEQRRKSLLEKEIGLWDIFECVERDNNNNKDSSIKKAKYNDISGLLNKYHAIKYLIFNSANAFNWLNEDIIDFFYKKKLKTKKLQSSSGGNAHFNYGKDWDDYFREIL